jgi:hypothetical protein
VGKVRGCLSAAASQAQVVPVLATTQEVGGAVARAVQDTTGHDASLGADEACTLSRGHTAGQDASLGTDGDAREMAHVHTHNNAPASADCHVEEGGDGGGGRPASQVCVCAHTHAYTVSRHASRAQPAGEEEFDAAGSPSPRCLLPSAQLSAAGVTVGTSGMGSGEDERGVCLARGEGERRERCSGQVAGAGYVELVMDKLCSEPGRLLAASSVSA